MLIGVPRTWVCGINGDVLVLVMLVTVVGNLGCDLIGVRDGYVWFVIGLMLLVRPGAFENNVLCSVSTEG